MTAAERITAAALVALVAALALVPLGRLLIAGVAPQGVPDLALILRVLERPATWTATVNTLTVAGLGTLLSTLLGVAMALTVGLGDVRARAALTFAFILPLIVPPQVTALAWVQLLGPGSPILAALGIAPAPGSSHPLYGIEGIALLLGVQHAPLVFLSLRAGLRALPSDLVEAARASGSGPVGTLRRIVLPLMAPFLAAGVALAFVSAVGNFGIPALLGIPGRVSTLPTLIYQRLSGFGPRVLGEVVVLSLVLLVIVLAGMAVQNRLLAGRDYRTAGAGRGGAVWALGRWRPVAEALAWIVVAVVLLAPLSALVAAALVPALGVAPTWETATLDHFRFVMGSHDATPRAFRNSFLMAGGAAVLLVLVAVPIGYFTVWRPVGWVRRAGALAELPYALPGVVLAIACILLFLRPIPWLGLSLYGTVWIIVVAYLARFLALALRPVVGGFRQLDPALDEAARMCGAGLGRRLRTIVFPVTAPVAAAGAILVFLLAFNELTVSALLWSSGVETLGVVVFGLEQGGQPQAASAVAVLTVLVSVGLMAVAQAFRRRLPPGTLPWQT